MFRGSENDLPLLKSGTALFCDLLQQTLRDLLSGWRALAAWPAEKVMAHGTPVETDARASMRRAFSWLA